jgi:hypothetical protein
MKTIPVRSVILVCAVIATLNSRGENASTPPEPLRANATNVEDRRVSDRSFALAGCRVTLTLLGDDLDRQGDILRATPTVATDDLGRDLLPESTTANQPGTGLRYSLADGNRPGPLSATITLRNPSRRAMSIKTLEANIVLYHPTEANGGVIKLPGVVSQQGEVLKSEALNTYGIELTYLSDQNARELMRSRRVDVLSLSSAEGDQRRFEAVAAEVSRRRAIRERAAATGQIESPLPDATTTTNLPVAPPPRPTTSPSAATNSPARGTQIAFEVKDPRHKFIAFAWRDAAGQPLKVVPGPTYGMGSLQTMIATEPLPADAQLFVYVASDEAVREHLLKVEGIALP